MRTLYHRDFITHAMHVWLLKIALKLCKYTTVNSVFPRGYVFFKEISTISYSSRELSVRWTNAVSTQGDLFLKYQNTLWLIVLGCCAFDAGWCYSTTFSPLCFSLLGVGVRIGRTDALCVKFLFGLHLGWGEMVPRSTRSNYEGQNLSLVAPQSTLSWKASLRQCLSLCPHSDFLLSIFLFFSFFSVKAQLSFASTL